MQSTQREASQRFRIRQDGLREYTAMEALAHQLEDRWKRFRPLLHRSRRHRSRMGHRMQSTKREASQRFRIRQDGLREYIAMEALAHQVGDRWKSSRPLLHRSRRRRSWVGHPMQSTQREASQRFRIRQDGLREYIAMEALAHQVGDRWKRFRPLLHRSRRHRSRMGHRMQSTKREASQRFRIRQDGLREYIAMEALAHQVGDRWKSSRPLLHRSRRRRSWVGHPMQSTQREASQRFRIRQDTPAGRREEEIPTPPAPKQKTQEPDGSPNAEHPKGSFIEVQNKAGWVTRIYSDGSTGTPAGRQVEEKGHTSSSSSSLKRHVGSPTDAPSKKKAKPLKKVQSQTSPSYLDVLNIAAKNLNRPAGGTSSAEDNSSASESKKRENVPQRTRKISQTSSETERLEVLTVSHSEKCDNIDVQKVECLFKASLSSPTFPKQSSESTARRVLKKLSVESSGTCNSTESESKSSVNHSNPKDDISLKKVEQLEQMS